MSEALGTRQAVSFLFLHARTPLHPGSGTALGVVDLPVQRERHTQWPLIPGSSIKGVLREAASRVRNDAAVEDAFGPAKDADDKHAGALVFTDARLLAFPVRALRGVFAWVTCPSVLDRFNRDVALMGSQHSIELPGRPADQHAICPADSPVCLENRAVVLEEFEFTCKADGSQLAEQLARVTGLDESTAAALRSRLVLLSDNDFTHFVRHATEVVARIGLDPQTKTVSTGALFYQEFLPTESIFYAVVIANPSRGGGDRDAAQMLEYVRTTTPSVLQIGGDETTGKGICAVHFAPCQESQS